MSKTMTADFTAKVFAEGPYDTPAQVETWLRRQLGATATVTFIGEDDTVHFAIETQIEDVEHEDHASEILWSIVGGGEHEMVLTDEDISVRAPYEHDGDDTGEPNETNR